MVRGSENHLLVLLHKIRRAVHPEMVLVEHVRVDHGGLYFGCWLVSLPQLRRNRGPNPPPDPVDSRYEPPADAPALLTLGSWALQPLFIPLHCTAYAVASK
jgi:hypothetical protein